jgi:hypothetical protein
MAAADKSKNQQFRKRKLITFIKAQGLAKYCGADVALIIHTNGRYYTYCSIDLPSWPPSFLEIVIAASCSGNSSLITGRNFPTLCRSSCGLRTWRRLKRKERRPREGTMLELKGTQVRRYELTTRKKRLTRNEVCPLRKQETLYV